MDDYNNISALPLALNSILTTNPDALEYYSNLDRERQDELVRYSNDFSCKEELERYLYYLYDDDFR